MLLKRCALPMHATVDAFSSKHGRLISTDFSPEMVEVARRRGAELGLENVD